MLSLTLAAFFVCVLSLGCLLFTAHSVWVFSRRRSASGPAVPPPVSVLKPLCGADHGLYENLRSVCVQDYPQFQIVFGVRDAEDPALDVVERLKREFPDVDIVAVVDERVIGTNYKVSNLIHMARAAKHEIFVVADSDVRVGSGYLRSIVEPFDDPTVGAVSCVYTGSSRDNLASRLGAMFINDWFLPGAVTFERMRGLTTAFGETLCIRRSVLEAVGGFESVVSHLADDTVIARRVLEVGYRLELSTTVVENVVDEPDLRSLFLHELRWARTLLLLEPVRYGLAFLFYPLPISVFAAAISLPVLGSPLPGLGLVALALAVRTGQHFLVWRLFRVRGRATPGLIPLRDALGFAIWLASFFGQSVQWRGVRFEVDRDGKLSRQS